MRLLRDLPYQDLDFAKVDHHRALRKGFPEVVFGQGKTPEQVAGIVEAVLGKSDIVLVTRAGRRLSPQSGPGPRTHGTTRPAGRWL